MNDFEQWYSEFFGGVLGSQDAENKEAVRRIWGSILIRAAQKFEFNDFDSYSGQDAGAFLRAMAGQSNGT